MTVDRGLVVAVFEFLVPDDGWPGLSETSLFAYLDDLGAAASPILELAATAPSDDLAGWFDRLEWRDRRRLTESAARAYYGDRDGPGAAMLGFRAAGSREPGVPVVVEPPLDTTPFPALAARYDVLVLGAGAGGGVAAQILAESGRSVLLVDRGAVLHEDEIGRDHLRNHRSNILGINTGPGDGNPRVFVDVGRVERTIDAPHDPRWHNNAMVVGGGTRVYQGMAWRFLPDDFAMATRYGVPEGSSLADWPIGYDDLVPHYEWVEWEVGVCGDPTGHRAHGSHRRGYPMPPLPPNTEAGVLGAGAAALGLATGPVPLLINSVPRNGRAQCVRCGECVGFACPSDAKNGAHNTTIPAALATGNATLADRVRGVTLTVGGDGTVTGADLLDERTGERRRVMADDVVVACGAIETARLLLASGGPHHPGGIGNEHDQVGRHLQGHGFVSIFGRFAEEVLDADGPGVSIATLDHAHGNHDPAGVVVGGGVLANEIVKLPIIHWNWSHDPDEPRAGAAAKAAMRATYRRTSHLFAQIQEIPRAENRVTLSAVPDAFGLPVARLEGRAHQETGRSARALAEVGQRWLSASGATKTWVDRIPDGLLAGQHQAGTCRMGVDPRHSVVGPDGRVHGHRNLWIADGSVHVTNGSVNPALTIMALAHRTASGLVASTMGARGDQRDASSS